MNPFLQQSYPIMVYIKRFYLRKCMRKDPMHFGITMISLQERPQIVNIKFLQNEKIRYKHRPSSAIRCQDPVFHGEDAIRALGNGKVMRNHDKGLPHRLPHGK